MRGEHYIYPTTQKLYIQLPAIIPINEEEKMSIIVGLRSNVPATKLITLKKVADIADMRPESLQYMDMIDKRLMQEITSFVPNVKNTFQVNGYIAPTVEIF